MARKKQARARSAATAAKRPGRGRGALRFFAYWSFVLGLWGAIGVFGVIVWFAYDLPDASDLGAVRRAPSVTLVAADGSTLANLGELYGVPVTLKELPPDLPHAVLATEDRRFYDHFGLDLLGLARATYVNLKAGAIVQGGSTISQQLAKNIFLTPERTLKRKVQEVLLALWLEHQFTKDEILTLYLNRVYLGAGAYGVEAASERYFGKPASRLALPEAAMLAGLLKAPSRYAPTRDLAVSRERAAQVLDNMVEAGYLEPAQAEAAKRHPARLTGKRAVPQNVRYFVDWAVERATGFVGRTDRDLVIVSTLDAKLQRTAEKVLERALAKEGESLRAGQGALLALTPDGAVKAMVGGRSYAESQFNRATQARRQPGSAFKLFVYLAGLEAGLTPDDVLRDEPIRIGGWAPGNYGGKYLGDVTAREALAKSINTVAVKVAERAGRDKVLQAARRLGIGGELPPHPSLALGTGEVTLDELTAAYAAVANGGRGVWPYAIEEIRDGDGHVLYRRRGIGPGQVIGDREVAYLDDMLSEVIRSGTGRAARLDRPAAGKTGTSQDFRDAWFIGYTAQLVAGVWLGNDDGSPMRRVTGGGLPARLWRDFMASAHQGLPKLPLGAAAPAGGGGATAAGPGFFDRLLESLRGKGEQSTARPPDWRQRDR